MTEADSDLLLRAQRGEMDAFEALVARHRDRVFGLGVRMLKSPEDAAEVAQETFLSAYQHLGQFRKEAAFGSWLYRIAANFALMRLRHHRVVQEARTELAGPEFNERGSLAEYPETDWSRRADEKIIDAELGRAIEQAADGLPGSYREVFLLKDVEGLSYEEIAEITGDSVAAVKSRLHRARLSLREAIDDFYNGRTKPVR